MDFWIVHGIVGGLFFCLMCWVIPRITLAFLAFIVGSIGITFWGIVGFFLAPRITIAVIATTVYWSTNPILCVLAWLFCFTTDSGTKVVYYKK